MSTIGKFDSDSSPTLGKVWIAGAGPGDPDLATVKVVKLLRRADVVFYDALGTRRLLTKARGELVFVGKRRGRHEMTQEEIQRRLEDEARKGKTVLRLKGGDPFVFGRGSEELDYLRERGVPVEVVPGVSSVLAAAAEASAPLTERNVSASCAIATGWPSEKVTSPDTDTVVYVMAAEALAHIARVNLEAGRPATTPVALVSSATLPEARVWRRTLAELSTGDERFSSPLTVIVGQTARSDRPGLPTDRVPVVWYTGLDADNYRGEGRLLHKPLFRRSALKTDSPAQREFDAALRDLTDKRFSWIVFTSRWSLRSLVKRLLFLGLDTRVLAGVRIAALGKTTAGALLSLGLKADLVPSSESLKGLVDDFPLFLSHDKKNEVFYPTGEGSLSAFPVNLKEKGWTVFRCPAFSYKKTDPDVDLSLVDRVVFTTARSVERFWELYTVLPDRLVVETLGSEAAEAVNRRL